MGFTNVTAKYIHLIVAKGIKICIIIMKCFCCFPLYLLNLFEHYNVFFFVHVFIGCNSIDGIIMFFLGFGFDDAPSRHEFDEQVIFIREGNIWLRSTISTRQYKCNLQDYVSSNRILTIQYHTIWRYPLAIGFTTRRLVHFRLTPPPKPQPTTVFHQNHSRVEPSLKIP